MKIAVFVMIVAVTAGCSRSGDIKAIREEIKMLHKANIEAHLNKDAAFLSKNFSENYFAVRNGEISFPTLQETVNGFSTYLNNTVFSEYRELEEPMIGCSKDGSLIWAVGKIKVKGIRKSADGPEKELDFICAWMTLYERRGKELVRLGDVSTFK
jgi:hypothetical protein